VRVLVRLDVDFGASGGFCFEDSANDTPFFPFPGLLVGAAGGFVVVVVAVVGVAGGFDAAWPVSLLGSDGAEGDGEAPKGAESPCFRFLFCFFPMSRAG